MSPEMYIPCEYGYTVGHLYLCKQMLFPFGCWYHDSSVFITIPGSPPILMLSPIAVLSKRSGAYPSATLSVCVYRGKLQQDLLKES